MLGYLLTNQQLLRFHPLNKPHYSDATAVMINQLQMWLNGAICSEFREALQVAIVLLFNSHCCVYIS